MSTATTPEAALNESLAARFRKTLIAGGFAAILLVPKVLNLRRNEHSWTMFRTVLGFFGAALVVLPIGFYTSYFLAVIGLVIFITAILLPPVKDDTAVDEKARELGALVVVNGGELQQVGALDSVAVQLFVGVENLWALRSDFKPVLVVPVADLVFTGAEEVTDGWILHLRWSDRNATFLYTGAFAEHLARSAESTVQSVMRPALPVIQRTRAAGAGA
jgi:hypothetical protein